MADSPKLQAIMQRSFVDGDCVIWKGMFNQRGKRCMTVDPKRGAWFDIRRYLTSPFVPPGHRALWDTTCGTGRCIARDHAVFLGTERFDHSKPDRGEH